MSEMIERVAAAIAEAADMDSSLMYKDMARAAIEAMREPTGDMKSCSEEVHWGYSCNTCGGLTEGWRKMIDAALKP